MRPALLFSLILLGACSPTQPAAAPDDEQARENQGKAGVGATAPAPASATADTHAASASASARSSGAVAVEEENESYHFQYSWPAAAGRIAPLRALLDKRMAQAKGDLAESARAARVDAEKEGYPYHPHGHGTAWLVVTDLPAWLSLSAEIWTYTGGAHGMSVHDALLWDKRAGRAMQPLDMFVSKQALSGAVRRDFCRELDAQRARKRQVRVSQLGDGMFSECIDITSATVILGSAGGKAFDRVGFLIPPYEAGPYAEGSYEVTLPVNAAVLATVKPEYRADFAQAR